MRVNFTLKTAVIITLFLSCFTTYSQSLAPFINQLEGLNEGKEVKITMIDGIAGKDYTVQYRLRSASNWLDSPVKIKKNAGATEGILTGLENNKNYCFRLVQRDSVTKAETISNEACSIRLQATLLSDKEVRLRWDKLNSAELRRISITIMDENGINMNNMLIGNLADTTFIFNQLDCLEKYKFNIALTFRSNNDFSKSIVIKSPQVLVDPKSVKLTPALSSVGSASINGNKSINYNIFSMSQVSGYEFYRSTNGGEMIKIGESRSNVFEDKNMAIDENQYCYAHKYVNGCGNESELSGKSCTIKLSSKTNGKLSWTPFIIQADSSLFRSLSTKYIVQLVSADGLVMSTSGETTDTTFAIKPEDYFKYELPYKFRILATIQGELNYNSQFISFPFFSYSNVVNIIIPPFISQLEGLNEGKEAKISMINGVAGKDHTIQYRLKGAKNWVDSPVKIKRITEVGEVILTGLENSKSYCFRIIDRDSITKAETISNEACSIVLKSALLSSKNVRLQWSKTDAAETSHTSIVVMEENGNNGKNLDFGQIPDTTFVHNELNCLTKFKFNVVLRSFSNTKTVIKSPQILVDPKSIATPPNLQSVDVVTISPDNQPFYDTYMLVKMPKYEFYRSTNGGEMIKVGEGKETSFADKNLDTQKNYYCYAHKYINECGSTSELSRKTCTMKMSSEPLGRFTWTPFKVYADTNLYKVVKTEYIVQVSDSLNKTIDYLDPVRDTTIIIENKYGTSAKYKVLTKLLGFIKLGFETRQFDISSYSNTVGRSLILGNESLKNDFVVFPNPAQDKILIKSSGAPVRFVELIDMQGRVIYKGETSDDTFNLSAFEKGKYILRLYDANKKLLNTKTLVKW